MSTRTTDVDAVPRYGSRPEPVRRSRSLGGEALPRSTLALDGSIPPSMAPISSSTAVLDGLLEQLAEMEQTSNDMVYGSVRRPWHSKYSLPSPLLNGQTGYVGKVCPPSSSYSSGSCESTCSPMSKQSLGTVSSYMSPPSSPPSASLPEIPHPQGYAYLPPQPKTSYRATLTPGAPLPDTNALTVPDTRKRSPSHSSSAPSSARTRRTASCAPSPIRIREPVTNDLTIRPRKTINLPSPSSPVSPTPAVSSLPSSDNFCSPPAGSFSPFVLPTSPTSPATVRRCRPPPPELFDALGLGATPIALKRTRPKQSRPKTSTGVPDRKGEVPPVPTLSLTQLPAQTFSLLSPTGLPSSASYESDSIPTTATDSSPTSDGPLSPGSRNSKISTKLRALSHNLKWRLSQPSLGRVVHRWPSHRS